jgi:hypothetical protein
MSFARMTELEMSYGNLVDHLKVAGTRNSDIGCQIAVEYVANHPALFTTRAKSRINSLKILIHELEKQEYLTPNNVAPLDDIVKELNNEAILKVYRSHRNMLEESPQAQIVPEQSVQQNKSSVLPKPGNFLHLTAMLADVTIFSFVSVRDLIVEKIGKYWTNLARNLDMPDAAIDEIEEKYKDNFRRIHEVSIILSPCKMYNMTLCHIVKINSHQIAEIKDL